MSLPFHSVRRRCSTRFTPPFHGESFLKSSRWAVDYWTLAETVFICLSSCHLCPSSPGHTDFIWRCISPVSSPRNGSHCFTLYTVQGDSFWELSLHWSDRASFVCEGRTASVEHVDYVVPRCIRSRVFAWSRRRTRKRTFQQTLPYCRPRFCMQTCRNLWYKNSLLSWNPALA